MVNYLRKAKELIARFSSYDLQHILRSKNAWADKLAKLATFQIEDLNPHVHFEIIDTRGTEEPNSTLFAELEPSWIDSIFNYLNTGALPEDKSVARKVTHQAPHYVLCDRKLYKRSLTLPLLKFLLSFEVDSNLREVYEGIYGNHLDDQALAYKILQQGYYWLTIHKKAIEHVRRCDACQRHTPVQHQPTIDLTTMTALWPSAQWGVDILGPFPPALTQ